MWTDENPLIRIIKQLLCCRLWRNSIDIAVWGALDGPEKSEVHLKNNAICTGVRVLRKCHPFSDGIWILDLSGNWYRLLRGRCAISRFSISVGRTWKREKWELFHRLLVKTCVMKVLVFLRNSLCADVYVCTYVRVITNRYKYYICNIYVYYSSVFGNGMAIYKFYTLEQRWALHCLYVLIRLKSDLKLSQRMWMCLEICRLLIVRKLLVNGFFCHSILRVLL